MPTPRQPLLIVPIRDRRQRRRILTIRNCAVSMLSVAVIVAAISIISGMQHGPADDYGRLFGKQTSQANTGIERKLDVIKEGPVGDQVNADPMLTAPAAREQVLMANTNAPAPAPVMATTIVPAAVPVTAPPNAHGTSIVGDGTTVAVVRAKGSAPQPVLAGGIFKQQ
jgi:hypothetical protein